MASDDNDPFKSTLKILRKVLFNNQYDLEYINEQARKTQEHNINDYARKAGYKSGLEYLQKQFSRYVVINGDRIRGIPEALYDTEALQRLYNLHVRTKDPNAKQLTMATRADDVYKETPVQPAPPPKQSAPAPASRRQPFAFEGSVNDVEITRLSQSDLRYPPMSHEPIHDPYPPLPSHDPYPPLPRSALPPGLPINQDYYSPQPPPGLPVGRDYYARKPATPDSTRRGTGSGFNIDEHKYVSPNHATSSAAYEDVHVPEQLPESEEMLTAQRVSDIFPHISTKADLAPPIKSKFFQELNGVAAALERINMGEIRLTKPFLYAQTPREYYQQIIMGLCALTEGGNHIFKDSLARAIHELPWQTLCHENGMTYTDLVRVLKAIPDYFEVYETERYNIPIYGITIKLPMGNLESKRVMDQLMPVIRRTSIPCDDSGFTSGTVIETKHAAFPYAIRFAANEDKYNKLAAALMKFTDAQPVQQTYPFMPVLVEQEFVYYRGRIITISDTKCRVELVDYGGTINVENQKLFVMPPKFAEYEYLAVPAEYVSGNLSCKEATDKPIKHVCSPKVLNLRISEDLYDYVCFKVN